MKQTTIQEPSREIPVLANYHAVVCGGVCKSGEMPACPRVAVIEQGLL